jgi:hypothetical protein
MSISRRQRQSSIIAAKLSILQSELEQHEKDLTFQQMQMENVSKRVAEQRKHLSDHQLELGQFEKECEQKSRSGVWITGSEHEKLYLNRSRIERCIKASSTTLEVATEAYQTERENRIANMRRIAQIKASVTSLQQDMDRLITNRRKNVLAQCIDDIRRCRWRHVEPVQNHLYL